MVATNLPAYHYSSHPNPGYRVSRSKFNFSEYGHVAYHIKENHECSNMVANILLADILNPGDGVANRSKFNFFRTWSCCISIQREHEMQQHGSKYFARRPLPHPLDPGDGVSRSKFNFFQNMVTFNIKLKGITNAATW